MAVLTIILMVFGGLTLYMRIRLSSKMPIDRLLTLATVIIICHGIHFYIVFEYFTYRPYLEALAPYRLLYAPMIYFGIQLAQIPAIEKYKKYSKIHLFPFIVFTVFYLIFSFSVDLRDIYGELGFELLLIAEILSYLVYAIASIILIYKSIGNTKWYPYMKVLGEIVVMLAILSGIFSLIEFFNELEYYNTFLSRSYDFNLIILVLTIILLFMLTVEQLIAKNKFAEVRASITSKNKSNIVKSDKLQASDLEEVNHRSPKKDKELTDFLCKLEELVNANWFLDPDINLNRLAKKTNSSKHFVSNVFNETLQVNFNQYFNQLRIEYLVRNIKNRMESGTSIESIEELYSQAGFKSKSTFNRHFKSTMNQTPTQFIDSLTNHV